jgi:hypothetical protein
MLTHPVIDINLKKIKEVHADNYCTYYFQGIKVKN